MKKHSVYLLILVLFTAGVFAYSSQKTLSQYDNTSAVTISNVRADNITQTSARILWDTNVAVDQSTVYWGTEPGVLSNGTTANDKCSSSSGSIDTANCIEILGLSPATVYYYKVQVYKTGGNLVHSSEYSFTTVTGETSGTGSDGNESTTNDPIDNTVSVAASLTGLVTNTLGTGISDAIVKIYTENYSFSIHGKTDSTGRYNIGNIPAGSYFVQVYIPTTSGYVAPEREYIVLSGGQSAELNFVLRWTTISISGKVFNGAEFAPGAFVWGWSEGGSYRSTEANSDGTYVLPVSPLDSWRMGAYLKKDDVFYRAEEIKIDAGAFKPGENIYSQDIEIISVYNTESATILGMEKIEDSNIENEIIQKIPVYEKEKLLEKNNRVPFLNDLQRKNNRYSTDYRLSKTALANASFLCEIDNTHKTFKTKYKIDYAEAHHLIPMKEQKNYLNVNIDRTENIICLCPTCHKAIHYAEVS